MKSASHRVLLAVVVLLILTVLLGLHKIRTFAQEGRQQQKMTLEAIFPKPSLTPAMNTESAPGSQDVPRESQATPPPALEKKEDPNYMAYLVDLVQKTPVIEICTWFEGSKSNVFLKFVNKPRIFDILVDDQIVEIALYSYRFPKNQAVMMQLAEEPTLVNDVKFALDIYMAKKEIEENLELARQIQMHGYYARVLAKIAARNPSIVGDSRLASLCQQFINMQEPLSQEAMNAEIFGFLQQAQVKPEEINFDPNYRSPLTINKMSNEIWSYDMPRKPKK